MTTQFQKFVPFAKIDAAKREVWGVVTAEVPDKENEVCDYEGTKPYYEEVVAEFSEATGGKSIFPLREMHQLSAVGKGIDIEYRDKAKQIFMGFKVVDDDAWKKVEEGVYTGFSHGGVFVGDKKPDPEFKGCTRYIAKPSEVSLVDNPCLATAHFDFIRTQGEVIRVTAAMLKAKISKGANVLTKRIKKADLPVESFAYVENVADPETWHFPVEFGDDKAEARRAIVKALSRVEKQVPVAARGSVLGRLIAASKRYEIDLDGNAARFKTFSETISQKFTKGMWELGRFAELLESFKYLLWSLVNEREWEGDESTIPDDVHLLIANMADVLEAYCAEEVSELKSELALLTAIIEAESDGEEVYAMSTKTLDLNKSMDFHKAAAQFHEDKASAHESISKLHKARAEAIGKTTSGDVKEREAFHKSMADKHEDIAKLHKGMSEVHKGMAAECSNAATDASSTNKSITSPTPIAPAVAPVNAVTEGLDMKGLVTDTLKSSITEAVSEVQKSDEFKQMLREAVMQQMRSTMEPTNIRTAGGGGESSVVSLVPRPGESVSTEGLDPELADMVSIEG